jgi:mannose-6-phosphate isomerase-like protein (cupin superfamily)
VVRAGERKRLSPRRGITYQLLTPDLSGHIELILSEYEVGAGTGEEAFAYSAEQCGLVLQGVAQVHLGDTVHRLRAGDSIRFDCSIPHRIANAGRGRLRCLWAISPPTF